MTLCPKEATFDDPLLDDFRNFLHYTLNRLKGVDPSPNQYEIADWIWRGGVLDHVKHPGLVPDKRMAEALRGVGKSTITYIYVPWEVRRAYEYTGGHPDCSYMVVSGTKDLADAASRFMRDLIEGDPLLQCLVPTDKDERWSGTTLNVRGRVAAPAPTIYARGLMTRLTGDRADCVVFDDIELPQNAETQGQREKLRSRAQEFVDVLTPNGEMIGLGTPQVEDTVYNEIEEWGFARRKWPARYPDPLWMGKHGHLLAPRLARGLAKDPSIEGTPTEPRFTEEVLAKREIVSRSRFQLQNMLDTSLSDEERYPLKLRDLIVQDLEPFAGPENPSWSNDQRRKLQDLPCVGFTGDAFYGPRELDSPFADYDYRIMSIDPSGKGADETAYAVIGAIGGTANLLECRGVVGGYSPGALRQLCEIAAKYRIQEIVCEDNFGNGMFESLLGAALMDYIKGLKAENPEHGWAGASITSVHHTANKELRIIDTLEPVMNQHRLVVDTEVVKNDRPGAGEAAETYRLFHQMTRIQRVKGALTHYDRLDALAIGIKLLTDRMGLQAATAVERRISKEERAMWDEYWRNNTEGGLRPSERQRHILLRSKSRRSIGKARRAIRGQTFKATSFFRT